MYEIIPKDYGVKLTFTGFIKQMEMAEWLKESRLLLEKLPIALGVLVDLRDLLPLPKDTETEMKNGQLLYKEKGMKRSAVILSSAVIALQFKRIAQETGIFPNERYINSLKSGNCEEQGQLWITRAVEPGLMSENQLNPSTVFRANSDMTVLFSGNPILFT